MKLAHLVTSSALLLASLPTTALAITQEAETASQPLAIPGLEAQTEMSRLAPLAGEWTATVSLFQPDGSWQVAGEERITIRYLLNGLALREDPADHPVNSFRLESTLQYDQNRDVFRLVAMDDTWGNMDIYTGGFTEDGRLVLDNLLSDTSYVGADGSTLHFRLTTRIEDWTANTFLVEMSADRGENWRPYQRIERRRFWFTDG